MTVQPSVLADALRDRYALERELGRGGMATVYLAHDVKHDRPVALKVLHRELAATLGPERFLREIQVAARLAHPHIVPLFDSGEAAGHLYYVMPYVEGESLRERLRRDGPLPLADTLRIAREAADGLDYAHRQGIVHRDIKPENILLEDGHALVTDFGIARALSAASGGHLTVTGLALGTPMYMSPEQATGAGEVDARSDIYSLGCVIYEMLTGQGPFTGSTPQAIMAARFRDRPTPLGAHRAGLPAELAAVVAKALSPAPAERFATAAGLAAALDTARDTATTAATPAARAGSRSRRLLLGGAAVAVAAVVTALGLKVARSPAPLVPPSGSALAVLPFRVVGPNLDLWREGMVDLLSIDLDGAAGLRTIHPRTVLSRWHRDLRADAISPDQDAALRVAHAVGARYALTGSVLATGSGLRITAELYDATSGAVQGRSQIDGPADSMTSLVDRLTLSLLGAGYLGRAEGRSATNLSGATTQSLAALKSFLSGEQKFRQARAPDAISDYQRAVEADSGFALAWYRLAIARGWSRSPHNPGESLEDIEHAERLSSRLPSREAALVHAAASLARGLQGSVGELRAIARQYPEDAESWFLLGDALFHVGGAAGEAADASPQALRKAIELDPDFAPAYLHLMEDAFDRGDSAAVARGLAELRRIDPTSDKAVGLGIAAALVWGDGAAQQAARAAMDTASGFALLTAKHAGNFSPDLVPQTLTVAEAAVRQTRLPADVRASAQGGMGFAHFLRGQVRRAHAEFDRGSMMEGLSGAALEDDRADRWLFDFVLGSPDTTAARRAYAYLRIRPDSVVSFVSPMYLGLAAAQLGAWSDVEHWAIWCDSSASAALAQSDTAQSRFDRVRAKTLRGLLAEHRGDRPAGMRALREGVRLLPRGGGWSGWLSQELRLELAKRYYAAGDLAEARRVLESFHLGDIVQMPGMVQFQLGKVYEGLGERARAREAYAKVVRWWDNADPILQPIRNQARERLAQLSQEEAR